MKRRVVDYLLLGATMVLAAGCSKENVNGSTNGLTSTAGTTLTTDVAQTSGQLASGTNFRISGSSSDSTEPRHPGPGIGPPHLPGDAMLDGTTLLAPTNQLLAIVEAESAGDFRGLGMNARGGATITNYDASGTVVTLPMPAPGQGPQGCSLSGGQFPQTDSLLTAIAKTVVDFGSGITEQHDTVTITRKGKIIITRSGDASAQTEIVTFEGYSVNDNSIEGTKTRVTTIAKTGTSVKGESVSSVAGGKITFNDGTVTTWESSRLRKTAITLDAEGRPASGLVTTDGSTMIRKTDSSIVYSHVISKTITEDIACRDHHGPVSGTVDTNYGGNSIVLDFGDGSCSNTGVTITANGVTTTRTIGG